MNIFFFISDLWKIWKERRAEKKWRRLHLEWLQNQIQEDFRWLCVDPVGREFVKRYQKMISDDWYRTQHESVVVFRKRVGMDPLYRKD